MKNSVKKITKTSLLGSWGAFRLLLLLPLVVFLVASCTLIDALKPVPTALPPETQTGANTFGCLVDGKLLVPYSDDSGYEPLIKELQSPYGGLFRARGNYYKDKRSYISCGFTMKYIQKAGIYQLTPNRNNPNFEITDGAIASIGEEYFYMLNPNKNN